MREDKYCKLLEPNKFLFGRDKKLITADTLEEAKIEFSYSCSDISDYSDLSTNWNTINEEPIGYKDGVLVDVVPPFGKIKIYQKFADEEDKENWNWKVVDTISHVDIALYLASPQQLLEHKKIITENSNENSLIVQSKGIMMLQQQARNLQLDFRMQKRSLMLMKNSSAMQKIKNDAEQSRLQVEQNSLNEKINIMSIYAGLGKEVVKIHNGEYSKQAKIDIFQSFRYIKEDMELLSDFENIDFTSLDQFDQFVSEHYKKLLPSELSIQAFKISKFPILYKSESIFGERLVQDEENNKIFILVRNGDNVYRFFNTYKLKEGLFSSVENLEAVTREIGSFSDSTRAKIDGEPTEFWIIKGNTENKHTWREKRIPIACKWYPDLDSGILDRVFDNCKENFEAEIQRRKDYIEKYKLNDSLDEYSWRWGMPYGRVKLYFFKRYHEAFEDMYLKDAHKNNNYRLMGILKELGYSTYQVSSSTDSITDTTTEEAIELRKKGYSTLGYPSYKSSQSELMQFDPETGSALHVSLGDCSDDYLYEGFFKEAIRRFEEKRREFLNKKHLENFHATAILQNIVDNKRLFPDHDNIDFIMGEGMEKVNSISDNSFLLPDVNSNEETPEQVCNNILQKNIKECSVGDIVYVIRNYEVAIDYGRGYTARNRVKNENVQGSRLFTHTKCEVTKVTKQGVTVLGDLDVHLRNNYNKNIWSGDPKQANIVVKYSSNEFGSGDIIFSGNLSSNDEEYIKNIMKQRNFREEHYLTYGLFFKLLLKIKKSTNKD